jgi:glycosyltransferase involved in cell wall biosynthesis
MGIVKNEVNTNARGGTELLIEALERNVPEELLSHFEIVPSRLRGELSKDKIKIYWAHDLVGDPECEHLRDGGWQRFDKIVFVSNWQMQKFIDYYNIPWSHCIVIPNAIDPIQDVKKSDDGPVKIIYHTTPHRGLQLLVPAFIKLAEDHHVELDVFSSFKMYGWAERDEQYRQLFDLCNEHPKINYHGYGSNKIVRQYVAKADIFAYPSIWQETGCCALMEAMSGGCLNVHPNYACLYETSNNWSVMYQWDEDYQKHVNLFYSVLQHAVETVRTPYYRSLTSHQKNYADLFYSWSTRKNQWIGFLTDMLNNS